MKASILALVAVTTAIVGCSKSAPNEESPNAPEVNPNVPVFTPGANNEMPPGSTPPGQPRKAPTGISQPAHPDNRTRVNPRVGAAPFNPPPRENPNAGPPKAGEQVASDYRVQIGDKTVEVEGVCKLTEDEAICWRPNGEKYDSLGTELTNAIKSKTDGYSNQFQFKFMKKNRILVLKSTTPPPKPGQGYSGSNGSLMDNMYGGGPDFVEGWTNNSSAFNQTSSTGFDQSRIERQVLTGAFNRETKTFPLRYQVTNFSQERQVVDFHKGEFTVDGNTYEITSISDKPESGSPTPYYGGNPNQKPGKMTYIKIKPIKITNPNSIVNLTPADDSGMPYGGIDDKGNPISAAEAQKLQQEESRKMMEASRAGRNYGMNPMMQRYIGSVNLDPSNFARYPQMTSTMVLNVDASKIKKLAGNVNRRTVYVFDKIKLDRN